MAVVAGQVRALFHGVGVHHSGLDRKYREAVEVMFRKRQLAVVFATGTCPRAPARSLPPPT